MLAVLFQASLADLKAREGGGRGLDGCLDPLKFLAGLTRHRQVPHGEGVLQGAAQGAGFAVPQLVAGLREALDLLQQAELGLQQFPLLFQPRQAGDLVRQFLRQGGCGGGDLPLPLIQVGQGLVGPPERLG